MGGSEHSQNMVHKGRGKDDWSNARQHERKRIGHEEQKQTKRKEDLQQS